MSTQQILGRSASPYSEISSRELVLIAQSGAAWNDAAARLMQHRAVIELLERNQTAAARQASHDHPLVRNMDDDGPNLMAYLIERGRIPPFPSLG